jgi:pyridoxine/pyridoxamine 5'-phosphate oxidase
MQVQNMDIYGHAPIPWSRALKQLEAQVREEGPGRTCWLATTDPDGRPHVAAVGAIWIDGKFYFVSGPRLRKSRNLASNPRCAVSVSLDGLDVVVEGAARKVTDPAMLERVVSLYASRGWPARVSDGAITAEYSAPSAGRGPWDLYELTPTAAVGVATKEPHGATRWRFDT